LAKGLAHIGQTMAALSGRTLIKIKACGFGSLAGAPEQSRQFNCRQARDEGAAHPAN
jgi:hypothetical protein